MKIICDTTFLDGLDRFEKGEIRVVDDARAAAFIKHGWAHAEGGEASAPAASASTDLDVYDASHKQEARNG
jgi:hypothetical protein